MSSNPERAPRRPFKREEAVIGFSPEAVTAPFSLRCGALLIDYLLVVIIPVTFLILARSLGEDGAGLIHGGLNNIGWLIAILVGFGDLILLPLATGQSVGKMLTGLRILRWNGKQASVAKILMRQTVGYLVTLITMGFGFLLAAFGVGRSLHDLIAGTVVVHARKQYVSK